MSFISFLFGFITALLFFGALGSGGRGNDDF